MHDSQKIMDGEQRNFADGGYSKTPPDSDAPAAQVSPVRVYIDGKEVMGFMGAFVSRIAGLK